LNTKAPLVLRDQGKGKNTGGGARQKSPSGGNPCQTKTGGGALDHRRFGRKREKKKKG